MQSLIVRRVDQSFDLETGVQANYLVLRMEGSSREFRLAITDEDLREVVQAVAESPAALPAPPKISWQDLPDDQMSVTMKTAFLRAGFPALLTEEEIFGFMEQVMQSARKMNGAPSAPGQEVFLPGRDEEEVGPL